MALFKLTDILQKLQQRHPALSSRLHEAQALSRWEQAVGPQIAKHSRAIRVENGVLRVEVDHPIWKSELHHRKRQILELLNNPKATTGEKTAPIQDIFFADARRPRGT